MYGYFPTNRSRRQEVFCKKGSLKNFAKLTVKHLCQSLLFQKVSGLRPAALLKGKLWRRCIPVNFAKFVRTRFYQRTSPVVASLRIVSEQFFPAGTDTFTTSYEKPDVKPDVAEIYDVLKKRRPCSNVVTASKQRQNKSFYFILCC